MTLVYLEGLLQRKNLSQTECHNAVPPATGLERRAAVAPGRCLVCHLLDLGNEAQKCVNEVRDVEPEHGIIDIVPRHDRLKWTVQRPDDCAWRIVPITLNCILTRCILIFFVTDLALPLRATGWMPCVGAMLLALGAQEDTEARTPRRFEDTDLKEGQLASDAMLSSLAPTRVACHRPVFPSFSPDVVKKTERAPRTSVPSAPFVAVSNVLANRKISWGTRIRT